MLELNSVDKLKEKAIRNGKVAVLISTGYGGGWFTWNRDCPECLFDPDVVAWVEAGKLDPLPDLKAKYNLEYFYTGGSKSLIIHWLPEGTRFFIEVHDGYETLVILETIDWHTA